MSQPDHPSGLVRIKTHDAWQGDLYLTERLTFTPHRGQAGYFSLLKEGGTSILNGDRIRIHSGAQVIGIVNGRAQWLDWANLNSQIHSFIISNGAETPDPVAYGSNYCLVVNLEDQLGLKSGRLATGPGLAAQWKAEMGLLVGSLADPDPRKIQAYQFSLERVGEPLTLTRSSKGTPGWGSSQPLPEDPRIQLHPPMATEILDGNKGLILIFLLMIILILCILIGNP